MGVLACDRVDCPEVMCDDLVLGHSRYICRTCRAELESIMAIATFNLRGDKTGAFFYGYTSMQDETRRCSIMFRRLPRPIRFEDIRIQVS